MRPMHDYFVVELENVIRKLGREEGRREFFFMHSSLVCTLEWVMEKFPLLSSYFRFLQLLNMSY